MGDVIKILPKGSGIETLYKAAEVVKDDDNLRVVVALFTEDVEEMTCMYSGNVDPVSAYYVLSKAALQQLGEDDE